MKKNTQCEMSNVFYSKKYTLNIPNDIPKYDPKTDIPLLTAYGCVLMERDTGSRYIYTVVNIKTEKKEVIYRSKTPLTTSGVDSIVEKISRSKVAGAGRCEADRSLEDKATLNNCREMLAYVFNRILPLHGFTVRDEQISLAKHILEAINNRNISLAEAEVGTGKTLAYLVPAIIAKRGKLNGYLNMGFYNDTPIIEMSHMPIVIATSSIALQKAIITDYIPQLSVILLKHGVIKTPLTAVLRKGRNNYVCKRNLLSHIQYERNPKTLKLLKGLLSPHASIDIAEIDGINEYIKRRITVPARCDKSCQFHSSCRYLIYRKHARSSGIDIQVCNHNYLLADIIHRSEDKYPLIPNYQSLIIDEAHKFLSAARSMYGTEISYMSLMQIVGLVQSVKFRKESEQKAFYQITRILARESVRLFNRLESFAQDEDTKEEADRFKAVMDYENQRHMNNVHETADELLQCLGLFETKGNNEGRKSQLCSELEHILKQTAVFIRHDEHICWLEIENRYSSRLCAIPKNIDKLLYSNIWSRGIPTILTSGTLSAAGDFSRIKRLLGIDRLSRHKVVETSKPSPFDYYNNSMLYISDTMPYPDMNDKKYIFAVADEIELLVRASHGHAAVLFTSFKVMDMVWEILKKRNIPFPMFRLNKGGVKEIQRFKESGNGILFAAGALWEGIDIPGDILSMLIIVKLPFQAPDPISEYEISLCRDFDEYMETVLKPDMLIKLKQGYGRPIRTEKDTAVIAIIDCRVGICGTYRDYTLSGLPRCYVTNDKADVKGFFHAKKSEEYFKCSGN